MNGLNGMNGVDKFQYQELDLDFKKIFYLLLNNLVWVILGVAIAYGVAWTYLRYTPTVYKVAGRILINENQQQPISENIIAQELGFVPPANNNNLENELQIFGSSYMMSRVVDSLNLGIEYYQEGRIRTSEIYKASPVEVKSVEPIEKANWKSIKLKIRNQEEFTVFQSENDTLNCRFDTPFNYGNLTISLSSNFNVPPEGTFIVKFINPASASRRYARKLNIQKIEGSNVLDLSLRDESFKKGIDVLNTLIDAYNNSVIERKVESGRKTLEFIDERLSFITKELLDVEQDVEGFKRDKSFPLSIEERAVEYLNRTDMVDNELIELQVNEGLLTSFREYITADSNKYAILPLTSEIFSGNNLDNIKEFNNLIFQKENLLENATPENPFYVTFDERLSFLRNNILLGIDTKLKEIEQKRKLLADRVQPLEQELNTIPTNQREFLQIMRQQQIKESLFLFLLQKREETALSIAAQVSDLRILEPVINNGVISPNKPRIYMLAIFLGLVLPAGLIVAINFLDTNIYSRYDIEKITSTPFLGSIIQSQKKDVIVLKRSSRSSIAEMFRLLRTNLQYVQSNPKDTQTILVTSSVSGEGKSFITINLGVSEALSGQKTILLGFDLRKPKLAKYLKGSREGIGLTNYLVGGAILDEIIQPISGYDNIDFISCGAIPPNPAELIMLDKTKELIEELKNYYNRIIIDTPPVGLVTDALLFKDLVDKSIFVVRSGKTPKGLPHPGIVLNGIKRKSGFGYGYRYGYGYNYGYGYGYYEDDTKKKRSWKIFQRN